MSKRHKKYDDDERENYEPTYDVFKPVLWWHWVISVFLWIIIAWVVISWIINSLDPDFPKTN